MSRTAPICRCCGIDLNNDNWYQSLQKTNDRICKGCRKDVTKLWQIEHPDKVREYNHKHNGNYNYPRRHTFDKNRKGPSFLGCYVAEGVLKHVFKDVQTMPMTNPGYDFVCNKGMKIDVKSSCIRKNKRWAFDINKNQTADYFLCIAFDNRTYLNPLYLWLIPGKKVNHLRQVTISAKTLAKWDKCQLDIDKVIDCCNTLKSE